MPRSHEARFPTRRKYIFLGLRQGVCPTQLDDVSSQRVEKEAKRNIIDRQRLYHFFSRHAQIGSILPALFWFFFAAAAEADLIARAHTHTHLPAQRPTRTACRQCAPERARAYIGSLLSPAAVSFSGPLVSVVKKRPTRTRKQQQQQQQRISILPSLSA